MSLDAAYECRKAEGRVNDLADLQEAVIEGAVQRIRLVVTTVLAIVAGLLPIMRKCASGCWSAVRGRLQHQGRQAKAG